MGQLVFQANAGGQTALVGPNPSTSISINIPATNGNMVTTGDSGTVTNTMLASNVYTAPGTIGSGTPNTGAFTTLSASSTVSGTGFSNYLASPPAIGGTTPSTGAFTTVTANRMADSLGGSIAPISSVMRNRIINGAMVIDQRSAGASTTVTAGGYFSCDRWQELSDASSKYSVQQSSTAATGFSNSLLFTSLSAYTVDSGETFAVRHNIEGFNTADLMWGTANAQTITLSFWVRSSLTGTFGGAVKNSAQDRSYPFTYTINSANTFEYKTVTIAGDTTGTWIGATNGIGIRVVFGLGVGSTVSGTAGAWAGSNFNSATGATSVVGTNGATFYITGVQLEVGTQATSFEYRQYGTELALCQRYYQKLGLKNSAFIGSGQSPLSNLGIVYVKYTTTMRASPTANYSGLNIGDGYNYGRTVTSLGTANLGPDSADIQANIAETDMVVSRPLFMFANSDTGFLDLTAEL
jgi:hypothetical protein